MSKIVVAGGTGYAGSAIVSAAAARGHAVTSLSRNLPAESAQVEGVTYRTGDVLDGAFVRDAVGGADALVSTMSPAGALDGRFAEANRFLAGLARGQGARLVVVGGFSSLRPAAGAPSGIESGEVPAEWAELAKQTDAVLTDLKAEPEGLDWLFVSPAAEFGSYVPGEDLGRYRVGDDIALFDEDGRSAISGADFARAIVDEIDRDARHRAHIGVAY